MEDLVKFAVNTAEKLGVSYAEARFQRNEGLRLAFKNGVADPAGFLKKSGLAVRVLVNGALGFASTNNLRRENVREIVESAYRTARQSSKLVKNPIRMAGVSSTEAKWAMREKQGLDEVGVEERLGVMKDVEKTLMSTPMSMKLVARLLEMTSETEEKLFTNSEGALIHGIVPRTRFFTLLTGTSEKGAIQRWYTKGQSGGWEVVEEWQLPEATLTEARKMADILDKGQKAPGDDVDVVLGSEIVGIICHESCGHPQEADRILGREAAQAGESYLKPDMMGFQVGSQHVTVVDDPTLAGVGVGDVLQVTEHRRRCAQPPALRSNRRSNERRVPHPAHRRSPCAQPRARPMRQAFSNARKRGLSDACHEKFPCRAPADLRLLFRSRRQRQGFDGLLPLGW